MNMKQNFFDQLDGGWGDLIADTYKKANEYLISIQATSDEGVSLELDYLDSDHLSNVTLQVNSIDIKMIHDENKYNNGKEMELCWSRGTFNGYVAYFYVWAENMLIDGMTVEDYFNKLKEEQPSKYRYAKIHKGCCFYIGLLIDENCEYRYVNARVFNAHNNIENINKYNMYVSDAVKEIIEKQMW